MNRTKGITLLAMAFVGGYVYGVISGWANAKEDSLKPITEQYEFTRAALWTDIKEAWRSA